MLKKIPTLACFKPRSKAFENDLDRYTKKVFYLEKPVKSSFLAYQINIENLDRVGQVFEPVSCINVLAKDKLLADIEV